MATESENASSGSNSSYLSGESWSSTNNILTENGTDATVTVATLYGGNNYSDWLLVDFNNFSRSSSDVINHVYVRTHGQVATSSLSSIDWEVEFSANSGSSWCSGHTMSNWFSTSEIDRNSGTCTHHSWTYSNINSLRARIRAYNFPSGTFSGGGIRIDHVEAVVDYSSPTVPSTPSAPTLSNPTSGSDPHNAILLTKPSNPSANGSTITHWQWQIAADSGFTTSVTSSSDIAIGTSSVTITDADSQLLDNPGTRIYARVRFKNGVGYSSYGSSDNEITVPDAPTLSASAASTSQINLSWTDSNVVSEYHYRLHIVKDDIPSNSTTVYYPMDFNANDESGNNQDATDYNVDFSGYDYYHMDGRIKGAVKFHSSSNATYVRIPNFSISGNDCLAFGGWLYHDGSGNETLLGDAAQSNTVGYIWTYFTGTQLNFQYARSGSTRQTATWSGIMSGYTNTWTHIFVVADYTAKTVTAYRNGVDVNTVTMTGTPVFPSTTRYRYIGNYSTSHSYSYHAYMDDFWFSATTTAWTDQQVLNVYERGRIATVDTNSTSKSASQSGLTTGTEYGFYIETIDSDGNRGDPSNEVTIYTLAATPDTPTLTAGVGQIGIDWSTSSTLGGRSTSAWKIEVSSNGSSGWAQITGSPFDLTTTSATHTGLGNGVTRYYRVSLANEDGAYSAVSSTANATTHDVPSAPGAPTIETPNDVNAVLDTAEFRITKPTSPADNGSAITHWTVQTSDASDFSTNVVNSSDVAIGTSTAIVNHGISGGTTVYVRVRFKNGIGYGSYGTSANDTSVTTPGVPSGLDDSASTTSSITVGWTLGAANGADVARLDTGVRYKVHDDPTYSTANVNFSTTSYTIPSLATNTEYDVAVRTENDYLVSGDDSAYTSDSTFYTSPNAVTNLSATADGVGQITVTWTDASEDHSVSNTVYGIYRSTDNVNFGSAIAVRNQGVQTFTNISLTAGTTYYYKIATRNGSAETDADSGAVMTGTSVNATVWDVPDTPSDPTLSNSGVGAITATKPSSPNDNGSTITNWQVQFDNNSDFSSVTVSSGDIAIGTSTFQGTGLGNGVTNYARVRFKNAVGYSDWSAGSVSSTTWNVPNKVTGLTYTSGATNSISFSWTAPGNNGSAITDYEYRGQLHDDSPDASFESLASTATSASNKDETSGGTNFTSNNQVEITVRAKNAVGTGAASDVLTAYTQPDTPTSWSASAGIGQIVLTWTDVAEDHSSSQTTYRIEVSSDNASFSGLATVNQGVQTYTHSSLGNGTTRYYKIRAQNPSDNSPYTSSVSATTHTVPSVPGTPTVSSRTTTSISLSWTAPSSNGGTAITDYEYRYKVHDGSFGSYVSTSNTTSATISSLTQNTKYTFEVRAENGVGYSSSSSASFYTVPNAPTGLSATASAVGQLTISWNAVAIDKPSGDGVVTYDVQFDTDASAGGETDLTTNTTSTSTTHSSLGNNTTRYYRVRASNDQVDSAYSSKVSGTTYDVPSAPGTPTTTGRTTTSISLSWTAPSSNGGTAITDYEIRYKVHDGTYTSYTSAGNNLTETISSLTQNTKYVFQVRAINAAGDGDSSSEASFYTLPQAPTGVSVTDDARGQLTVSWNAVAIDKPSGDGVTKYDLQRATDSSGTGATEIVSNTTSTSYSDTGLGDGTTRFYRVRAQNDQVVGDWSSAWSAAPSGETWDVPNKPTNITINSA